jgi:hypothetical protein
VELEFKPEGKLKDFSGVDLRIGEGDNPPVTAPLREDRSKPGHVVVSFTSDRAQLDKLKLWVMVPESLGGTIYDLRVKDFVEPKKELPKPPPIPTSPPITSPRQFRPDAQIMLSTSGRTSHSGNNLLFG